MGTPRHGHARPGHKSATYKIWIGMRQRCLNPRNIYYRHYGGRGIAICDRWLDSFENFLEDMGERPTGLTIDRIDNDGNYEPENCRWATREEQSHNSRQTRMFTFNGETRCLGDWARLLGMNRHTLRSRLLKSGWSVQRAMETPAGRYRRQ